MCGIIGYTGTNNAFKIINTGLLDLDYRGYDSWGICVKDSNESLINFKQIGKVELVKTGTKGNIGIGHTRWATHGGITKENAHPHLDEKGNIAIAHNGIIENYNELKTFLLSKHHKFTSETDSECIVHLIEEFNKKLSIEESTIKAFNRLSGKNAIIVLDKKSNILYACKNLSSLYVGIGKQEKLIVSDISAFTEKIETYAFVPDNILVKITEDNVDTINLKNSKRFKLELQKYNSKDYLNGKDSFKTYYLKEITETPLKVKDIYSKNKEIFKEIQNNIKKSKKIILTGCGSAYYTCLIGKYMLQDLGYNVEAISAGEFKSYINSINNSSQLFVIAVSQSGETADLLEFVDFIKTKNIKIASITNNIYSNLALKSNFVINLVCGSEKAVASTKAVMNMMSSFLIIHSLFKKGGNKIDSILKEISKSQTFILNDLKIKKTLRNIAKELKDKKDLYIIGKGINYPLSLETGLKFKETTYIHAEGFASSELKHGPLSLIEQGSIVIIFANIGEFYNEILSTANEVKARGAQLIGIGDMSDKIFDQYILYKTYKYSEYTNIFESLIIVQLLCGYIAKMKGIDIDKPRNLAKSVTVK